MLKFSANLSLMFTELNFLERFAAANKAGFNGIEFFFQYSYDKNALSDQLEKNDQVQVLFSLPPGDWEAGEVGIACHPDRVEEFQEGVGIAIEYAIALNCNLINCIAGITPAGADPDKVFETYLSNIRYAASEIGKVGKELVIEPVNTYHRPGFYLNRTDQAVKIIDQIGVNSLGLQYDVYHAQVMEGNLSSTIETNLEIIRHIQIADNPGHHEPGTGEINFNYLLPFIDRIGYKGWIGCEYEPRTTTLEGLGWLNSHI